LASSDLQPPAVGELTSATTNKASFWQTNGEHVLKQGKLVENADGQSDFTGNVPRRTSVRKARKVSNFVADKNSVMGGASAGSVTPTDNAGQFFTFTFSKKYEQLFFEVMSMNTRGFKWISLRQPAVTQTQTHTAKTANATMVQPVVTPGKQVTVVAQVMLSNAEKVSAVGFAGNDRTVITLPLEATARITEPSKVVIASPMTSSVLFPSNYAISTTASDQVIVYVLHEDPILYLREDIIK
jgi:hypothetical protein